MNRPHPKPTAEDRKNYNSDETRPDITWTKDQRVRARFRIFDCPGHETDDWGWVSAEKGEMGTVVYIDKEDGTPTVCFDNTGCSTCVSNHEVDLVDLDLERYALNSFFLGITSRLAWGRDIKPDSYRGPSGGCFATGFEVAEAYLNDISNGKVAGLSLANLIETALRNLDHEKL